MSMRKRRPVRYDIDRVEHDMAGRGWIPTDLARQTGLSDMTISRFLRRERQTARTAGKIAVALGQPLKRYILQAIRKKAAA